MEGLHFLQEAAWLLQKWRKVHIDSLMDDFCFIELVGVIVINRVAQSNNNLAPRGIDPLQVVRSAPPCSPPSPPGLTVVSTANKDMISNHPLFT